MSLLSVVVIGTSVETVSFAGNVGGIRTHNEGIISSVELANRSAGSIYIGNIADVRVS